MSTTTIGLLLYAGEAPPRNAATEEKYRLLVEKIRERRWEPRTLTYHDAWRDALRGEALQCDAVLAWINPSEPQLDRPALHERARIQEVEGGVAGEEEEVGPVGSGHVSSVTRCGWLQWRRGGDSNPRYVLRTHAFQACSLSHSDTSPRA